MDLVWQTAQKTGLRSILGRQHGGIEDDHLPFADVGIPVVDIIDRNCGPNNSFHHTDKDTLDKVSPASMEEVGKLVLAMLPLIQERIAPSESGIHLSGDYGIERSFWKPVYLAVCLEVLARH